jgi:hypothetical protein
MMLDMLFDMAIGMILGMAASPLMMKAIRIIKQRQCYERFLNYRKMASYITRIRYYNYNMQELAIKPGLRRIIIGGRLYNYSRYADKLAASTYVENVIKGKIIDPVILFQLKNGFRLIKILPDYLYDRRSCNYAAFMEWLNPHYYSRRTISC